ncbi:MAG: hypothetical protein LBS87_02440 [Puniceicoccales bacterium]|jgi:mRNA-degrading endonuclease RelE of RelBE toxin-antitoxin system|nr:hypothetical protein [Puniceicoccales bacterium]
MNIGGVTFVPKQGSHRAMGELARVVDDAGAKAEIVATLANINPGNPGQNVIHVPLGDRQVTITGNRVGSTYTVYDVNVGEPIEEPVSTYLVRYHPGIEKDLSTLRDGRRVDVEDVIKSIGENPLRSCDGTVKGVLSQFGTGTYYIREGRNHFKVVFSINEGEKEVFIWGVMSDNKYERIRKRIRG